jgi:hypothetical protein
LVPHLSGTIVAISMNLQKLCRQGRLLVCAVPSAFVILRKEVIQPHLPVQLPCYDFVPVTSPAFGGCVLTVRPPTSGMTRSHDVTGGVYKARERIQRSMADLRLLATPTSCRRVAADNPN